MFIEIGCEFAPALQRSAMFPAMVRRASVSLRWSEEESFEAPRSINIMSLRDGGTRVGKNLARKPDVRPLYYKVDRYRTRFQVTALATC
jgi:hypothetical protein